jgi:GT2 family glycosyltransferase
MQFKMNRVSLLTVRFGESQASIEKLIKSFRYACRQAGIEPDIIIVDSTTPNDFPLTNDGTFNLINTQSNVQHSKGINIALRNSTSEFVLIANPDLIFDRHSVDILLSSISQKGVGLVEGRQVPFDHPKAFDELTGETSWGSGAFMFGRRSLISEIGGFDELNFPMYCNDVDLSWRIRARGLSIRYEPRAFAHHTKHLDSVHRVKQSCYESENILFSSLLLAYKWRSSRYIAMQSAFIRLLGSKKDKIQLSRFRQHTATLGIDRMCKPDSRSADFHFLNISKMRF